jgi:WD40 repeat protein
MFDCRRWFFTCLAAGFFCRLSAEPGWAGSPSFDGFLAVPQFWRGYSTDHRFLIAPNGRWFASTSDYDRDIQIVDMESGTIMRTIRTRRDDLGPAHYDDRGHDPRALRGVGLSADGIAVIGRFGDGHVVAWSAETGASLPLVPPGVAIKSLDGTGNTQEPYTIVVSTPSSGTGQAIDISSGSKTVASIHFDVPDTCGSSAANPTFDGRHLLFRRAAGEGDGISLPAIAYQLHDGAFREMWRAPCNEFGHDGGDTLLADAAFLRLIAYPVGPVTLWDLATNTIAAQFENADGAVAISADRSTIVASGFADADLKLPIFTVLQADRRTSFPHSVGDVQALFLSPNGRWLAATKASSTFVWSLPDGALRQQDGIEASGLSNDGVIQNSSAGQRKDEEVAINGDPITRQSANGLWAATEGDDIVDTKSGRRIVRLDDESVDSFPGTNRALINAVGLSWRLIDLTNARPFWTLEATPDVRGYVMTFPNGCVQVAPGEERFVALVRGFEIRPFDAAAAKIFARPDCKGRPEAIAASTAALVAAQTTLVALAREDEMRRVGAETAAAAEAARLGALRRQAAADDQERQQINDIWEHREARTVGGPQRAALLVAWPLGLAPGRVSTYHGTVSWSLDTSKEDGTKAAVAEIKLPDVHASATIRVSRSKPATRVGAGTIDLVFKPEKRQLGSSAQSVALPIGRDEAASSGEALRGDVTTLSADVFRIDVSTDMERMRSAYWIDIPMVMTDGLRATLTFEKGTLGQQIVDDALKPPERLR